MEHLKRIEDLTSRYALARRGGAGLGPLWALALASMLLVLIGNYASAEFSASGNAYPGIWRFLFSDTLVIPAWIKLVGIAVSISIWVGIIGLQLLIDRRFGVAVHRDPVDKLMRFLMPALFIFALIVALSFNWGQTLATYDNAGNNGQALLDLVDFGTQLGWAVIAAWGVIWIITTRDSVSRTLACLITMMLIPVMSTTFDEVDFFMIVLQFILLLVFAVMGLRQFVAFLKVRGEINSLPVAE